MALHGAESNEANNFPSTVPDLIKILPKRETTLHIRMGDNPNIISNQSTPSSSSSSSSSSNNNRHHNHHSHNHRHNNNINSKNSSNSTNNNNSLNSPCYHTLRYDFKPASINSEEPAILELTQNGQVTIKAPNVGGSVASQTVFRGQRRPHVKECLLVIDNSTGEMVLQKLTDNITVKATRSLGGGTGGGTTAPATTGGNGGGSSGGISSSVNTSAPVALTTTIANMTSTTNSITNTTTMSQLAKMDGPQLSEESSSSDDSSSTSSSSSSSSSSNSGYSSPNNEGFTF